MKRIQIVVMVIFAGLFTAVFTGCASPSQGEKQEIVAFYMAFAKEATSLDSVQIKKTYDDLAGKSADAAKEEVFAQFDTLNPEFFNKIHLTDSTYAEVGKTYSTVLQLSLATGGEGVDLTMPLDAVTSYEDKKLGKRIYEIDRKKITATVTETLGLKVTRVSRSAMEPVKLIKDGDSWKVLADNNMLTEIGTPLSEKISATADSK